MYAIPTTDLCWGFLELLHRIPQKKKHAVDLHELEIWEVSFLNQLGSLCGIQEIYIKFVNKSKKVKSYRHRICC